MRSRTTISRLTAVLALTAFAAALPASSALAAKKPAKAPAGSKFYTPPKKLTGAHGDLIWARKQTGPDVLTGAAKNYLVLYRSTSVSGKAVAVSGSVSIPKGKAPKGGWPVISYAHGTTGVADICAPTRDTVVSSDHGYVAYIYPELNAWLAAGYAVARTDYEGLGTPGPHPYLIGTSEGRGVVDIVTAAGQADKTVGRNWVASGHSQGGHAALFAAAIGPKWAPKLHLKGVDAFAPASHVKTEVELAKSLTAPSGLSGLGSLLVAGAVAASPSTIKTADLLTPAAQALYPQVETKCLGDLSKTDSWGAIAPSQIVRDGYDRTNLYKILDASDPTNLTINVPTLIQQGDADSTVFKSFTDPLVDGLKAKGAAVDYKVYPGIDHGGVVAAGLTDATAWLKTVLK